MAVKRKNNPDFVQRADGRWVRKTSKTNKSNAPIIKKHAEYIKKSSHVIPTFSAPRGHR